jgi:hypothetical protein
MIHEKYNERAENLRSKAKEEDIRFTTPEQFVERTHAKGAYEYTRLLNEDLQYEPLDPEEAEPVRRALCQEHVENLRLQLAYEESQRRENPGDFLEPCHRKAIKYDKTKGRLSSPTGTVIDTDHTVSDRCFGHYPKNYDTRSESEHPVDHERNIRGIAEQTPRETIKENHSRQEFNYSEPYRVLADGGVPETMEEKHANIIHEIGIGNTFMIDM